MPDKDGSAAQWLAADPPQWLTVLGAPALGSGLGIRRLDRAEWEEFEYPADYPAQTIAMAPQAHPGTLGPGGPSGLGTDRGRSARVPEVPASLKGVRPERQGVH